ncbi:DUF6122 family protein [Sungkyunkwania multivorans]|uniref:DUF6122 family protein n=1 Tax=Sungkyunkwania multivorans TaxID=1173618 RepID=A0ABW3CXB8_9FLAO
MGRMLVHYGFHFVIPLLIALLCYRTRWKSAYLLFLAAMLIDLDHLLATPIFDASRCSINFHPLHSYYAIAVYIILLIPKWTRIIGVGLMLHILADQLDCWMMNY